MTSACITSHDITWSRHSGDCFPNSATNIHEMRLIYVQGAHHSCKSAAVSSRPCNAQGVGELGHLRIHRRTQ
jgi:hypothetical protein